MATLGELLRRHEWEEIKTALVGAYPDQEDGLAGYEGAWRILHYLIPIPDEYAILIEWKTDPIDGTRYVDVTAEHPGDDESYSLMFTDWAKWLSMDIVDVSLAEFGEAEILVHCLWEMTYAGYTPDAVRMQGEFIDELYEDALVQWARVDDG